MSEVENTTCKMEKINTQILAFLDGYLNDSEILILECPSKYLQWKLFKVLKNEYKDMEIKHADSKTLKGEISSTSQGSLFDDFTSGGLTCLFFKGKITKEEYALLESTGSFIVFADLVNVASGNVLKVVNQKDKLMEIFFDYFRSKCESIALWQEILQGLDRDDDLGRLLYNLEVLVSLEGVISKEVLNKYNFDFYSANLMFGLQDIFVGKQYSLKNWKGLFMRFAPELPVLRSYLKNLGEKLMFLEGSDDSYASPIKSMHPYAKKKLEETIKNPGWKSKGVFKFGQLLKFDRLLRRRTVSEEDLIKSLVS